MAPDRDGKLADVLLGYDKADDYVNHPNFFGVTVGRFANRIGGGRFTLDGRPYQLTLNDKVNAARRDQGLDGNWRIVSMKDGPTASVVMARPAPTGTRAIRARSMHRHLFARRGGGADHRVRGEDRQADHRQHDEPRDLQPERRRLAFGRDLPLTSRRRPIPWSTQLIPTASAVRSRAPSSTSSPRVVADGIRDGNDQQIRYGQGLRP
jgi:aldose 1-epimerase